MAQIHQLLRLFSLSRAESWDKVGLQIGDKNAEISSVFVAHEVTDDVLGAAQNHDVLAVYHPLIFRPLENLDFSSHTARLAAQILRQNQHLICLHTALDNAPPPEALGDHLARQIGLRNIEVLDPSGAQHLVKIVVFVPPADLEKVSNAMWEAGAGQIGRYDQASFRAMGTGTFRPLEGANPSDGEIGFQSQAEEWRLEVIAPVENEKSVVASMKAAHSYEEVAYEIFPIKNSVNPFGSARKGEIEPQKLEEFAASVQRALDAPNLRIVKAKDIIQSVACVPGSGASYLSAVAGAGIDCLVTGDLKHHDALQARALDVSLIDATHVATERAAVALIAQKLETIDGLKVTRGTMDTNPFSALEGSK